MARSWPTRWTSKRIQRPPPVPISSWASPTTRSRLRQGDRGRSEIRRRLHRSQGKATACRATSTTAISDFDQGSSIDPKFATAFDNRGIAYVEKGEYARGVADFDAALKIDPMMTIVYTHVQPRMPPTGKETLPGRFRPGERSIRSDPYIYLSRGNSFLEGSELDRAMRL